MLPLQASSADLWEVTDGQENTKANSKSKAKTSSLAIRTWKALRNRKMRSYASLGGRRLRARRTVSDSSGMRSSALSRRHSVRSRQLVEQSVTQGKSDHLSPSFLYPAASAYQLAKGVIQRLSHGRLMINFVKDGADISKDLLKYVTGLQLVSGLA